MVEMSEKQWHSLMSKAWSIWNCVQAYLNVTQQALLDTETALSQPPVVDAQKTITMPRIFLIRTPVI